MERALSVIDYALLVVSGSEGVQAHTRTLYRLLRDRGIPVFVFVNKMDIAVRQKADILSELASELDCGPVDFSGVLEGMPEEGNGRAAESGGRNMPNGGRNMPESAALEKFIDDITLYSPELADMVLEGELEGAPDDASVAEAVRRCEIVPCIFGSALKLEGIEDLLETLGRFTVMPEYSDEFGARIYKTAAGDDGSRLVFAKITGGTLRARDTVAVHHRVQGSAGSAAAGEPGSAAYEGAGIGTGTGAQAAATDDSEAKINQIRIYSGSRFTSVNEAEAGSVCALTGLPDVMPGDSLGAEMPAADPVIRPFMVYTVSGPAGMDPYLVMKDLEKLAQEDPSLSVRRIRETGEIEIRLMGQVQQEVLTTMIKDRYGYDVTFGNGKVLYLETVTEAFEGVGHFEPLRHYAEVHLIVEPGERGSGVVISSITPEDELARNWQRLILTHIDEKEHRGVLTGAPVTDVRITLAAGKAHDKHTSGGDFREATYRAVRNALMQARAAGAAALLEPWNEYEIELPSQAVGRAMTDIQQMGGTQESLEQEGDTSRIRGRVPASEIAGYQQTLISYTSGTGRLSCTPAGYAPCHAAEKIIEESGYDPERDIDNPADSVFVSHGGSDIVKWDEVPEHMHIGSVLRRYMNAVHPGASGTGSGTVMGTGADYAYGAAGMYTDSASDMGGYTGSMRGGRSDSEARKRQLAAEKELRMIFERTYGPSKERTGRSARENRFGPEYEMPEKTEEQKAADELRNRQIREKHEKKKVKAAPEDRPVLLIDGYNLIHADEYLKDLAKKDMGGARDQLLERLCNYAAYTGSETVVVFDAYNVTGGEGYEEDHLGVRVIFTSENEPADIRIGMMTNTMKNRRIYVVSSDVLVQQDSFEHGALRISSREFMRLLAQTEEEIRGTLI